jgi:YVTN family beta-propeller protein
MTRRSRWGFFTAVSLTALLTLGSQAGEKKPPPAATEPQVQVDAEAAGNRYVKDGVVIDFELLPPAGSRSEELMEGQVAEVRFRITEEATGAPVKGITPGAWMDMAQVIEGRTGAEQKSCKDKIALYLGGAVGIRPMLDLNSYYIVVMNREPTISIVDPLVSMVGKTSTLAMIRLKASGSDWTKSADERRLFVSMPEVDQIAVVDTENFELVGDVDAGKQPTRVALQPDGHYLWVGNNADSAEQSGVSVIDTETLKPVKHIATGMGHHEIAFSDDSRHAFVSNRESGTVTVIDVQKLEIVKQVATGPVPISVAWSSLAKTLYVADGQAGTVSVLGGDDFEVRRRIELAPGLGPLRFSQDGRFALVVNPAEDKVVVLDPATDKLLHSIEVKGKPFQVTFSRAFAYVRPLASEQVTLINLLSLGEGKEPIVQRFAAGAGAPQLAGDLPLADSIATSTTEAAGFMVNPADNTTYFYMEGMNAPSSNYKVYGASARAVTVVDRSLKEVEPGVYASKVKIPTAGKYDVAFLLETPRLLHCFAAQAKANPLIKHEVAVLGVEYLRTDRRAAAGEPTPFRFRLVTPSTGLPRSGLKDVRVLFFRLPGKDRTEVAAEEEGDGIYRAMLPFPRPGAYYVYVGVRSENVGYEDLPYFSMQATQKPAASSEKPAGEEQG